LSAYLEEVATGADILQRNLMRAGDLVASFKQVAVDCSSSQLREFRLQEVIRETLLTLRPAFKKLPVRFEQEIPETIYMHSYPGPLTQVITNLVNNAVIHGLSELPQGQVTVAATQISDQEVQITVTDNGRGIPPENMQRIFEPFFTTRLGHGGSGLGLHIVYNNVTQILRGKNPGTKRARMYSLHAESALQNCSKHQLTAWSPVFQKEEPGNCRKASSSALDSRPSMALRCG
jgi:signal transduction histidine kinase